MIFLEYNPETGLVVNAIEYDGLVPYAPPEGLALIQPGDSGAWIGWTYDGETFTPPLQPEPEPEPAPETPPEF